LHESTDCSVPRYVALPYGAALIGRANIAGMKAVWAALPGHYIIYRSLESFSVGSDPTQVGHCTPTSNGTAFVGDPLIFDLCPLKCDYCGQDVQLQLACGCGRVGALAERNEPDAECIPKLAVIEAAQRF
jgi:hypothetical protein